MPLLLVLFLESTLSLVSLLSGFPTLFLAFCRAKTPPAGLLLIGGWRREKTSPTADSVDLLEEGVGGGAAGVVATAGTAVVDPGGRLLVGADVAPEIWG